MSLCRTFLHGGLSSALDFERRHGYARPIAGAASLIGVRDPRVNLVSQARGSILNPIFVATDTPNRPRGVSYRDAFVADFLDGTSDRQYIQRLRSPGALAGGLGSLGRTLTRWRHSEVILGDGARITLIGRRAYLRSLRAPCALEWFFRQHLRAPWRHFCHLLDL